jgi:REP element-mobilizing transposase RayT
MIEKRQRKTVRLREYDYSQPGEYFVTICTKNHECMFGSIINGKMDLNERGRIIDGCWKGISEYFPYVGLDEYIIMPNHFHGIIIINEIDIHCCRGEVASPLRKPTLGNMTAYFKYQSTKLTNESQVTPGAKVWQRNYFDRIIRGEKELQNIRDYISNNVLAWAFETEHPENIPL